jgi:Na+/H+ antiporter NhaD/arsenite permease-like protein
VTAPLIANLFLLAISAIGRREIRSGTLGADNIVPIDIMAFFLALAYIAISIDASGLIRYLASKVLQTGGRVGHRLFFYLYALFFALSSFVGNDPVILSGTAFLAYMTCASSNIMHPRAWIHSQFAIANIASAILVSSNPTNLVLAGAFQIKFVEYTANMVVPVVITSVVLFPLLLYIVFADESLIPLSIERHELSEEEKANKPRNPNVPRVELTNMEQRSVLDKNVLLREILNPYLDKRGAAFGTVIMCATALTALVINAVSHDNGQHPVSWVAVPAALVMLCWDLGFGWYQRHDTREIARKGREGVRSARAGQTPKEGAVNIGRSDQAHRVAEPSELRLQGQVENERSTEGAASETISTLDDKPKPASAVANCSLRFVSDMTPAQATMTSNHKFSERESGDLESGDSREPPTLVSLAIDAYSWLRETFPTATAVIARMPFALVPFTFSMCVLVQALTTKGWVPLFAYGWDHWVNKTGTVGAIAGMGFLSVLLCNVSPITRILQLSMQESY